MEQFYKIALYGDSLSLPRKGIVKYNERYFFLIEEWLKNNCKINYFEKKDRAKGAITITELNELYDSDKGYFDFPGDIVLFQAGIVDCAPRPVKESTKKIISKLPLFIKNKIIKYLHDNRSSILKRGNVYVKTEKNVFYNTYKLLINKASVDYKAVYIINICPTNNEIELRSPGIKKNIDAYNAIIQKIISEGNFKNVFLIDVFHYVKEHYNLIDDYIVKIDGHHITKLTHQLIADKVIEIQSVKKC